MARNPRMEGMSAVERAIELGMMAGMAAAVPMGIFALIASATWQHTGFFTPVYRIASMLDPSSLAVSLEEASFGSTFYFDPQPFFSGGTVHLALGGFFGVIFALLWHRLRWRGRAALVAGIVYGLAVMALMSLVVLPLAAGLVGAGGEVADTASIPGWPTFTVAHLLYGLGLGTWATLRPPP
jgi:hypothetical protein